MPRCNKCGEALIPRADHQKGRYVYLKHDHTSEGNEKNPNPQDIETIEKECPRCDGKGTGPYGIHKCKKCYGSGTVKAGVK